MTADVPSADQPQVSVVIPARNAAATLGAQLAALSRQSSTRDFEVLVADNGSTDATAEVVACFSGLVPGLRLVDASARTGANAARNSGTRAARGEYILLCDADDEVDPGWVQALAAALDHADAVGGHLELAAINPDYIARWGGATVDAGITSPLGFLARPVGANAGYRRTVWEELGGFDESYARGGTETEFYWRLQLAGHTLADVPEAVVHYRMRSSFRAVVRQMYIWGRQHPMLYRDFRAHGLRFDARGSARAWLRLGLLLWRTTKGPWHRLNFCRKLAYRVGRVVGSVQYRVVFP